MDSPELDPEQEEQKLDDLGQRIDHARAEIDREDPNTEHEQTFVSSGADEADDDQTIAPPG